MSFTHVFAGNPLDRADAKRRDPEWLAAAASDPASRYLPLWQLNVLLESGDALLLVWLSYAEGKRL